MSKIKQDIIQWDYEEGLGGSLKFEGTEIAYLKESGHSMYALENMATAQNHVFESESPEQAKLQALISVASECDSFTDYFVKIIKAIFAYSPAAKDALKSRKEEPGAADCLTINEIDYLLNAAKKNRENSAALAEIPDQRWKEAHKVEVVMMDRLIDKLEQILVARGFRENGEYAFMGSGKRNLYSLEEVFLFSVKEGAGSDLGSAVTALVDIFNGQYDNDGRMLDYIKKHPVAGIEQVVDSYPIIFKDTVSSYHGD